MFRTGPEILQQASQLVSTATGCKLYAVSNDKDDANSVYVTEIWESKDVSFWKLKTAYLRWSKKNPQPKKNQIYK